MHNVVQLRRCRLPRTARGGASDASASNVIPFTRLRLARPMMPGQLREGMRPRAFQDDTTDGLSRREPLRGRGKAPATKLVPPSASMIDVAVGMPASMVRRPRTCQDERSPVMRSATQEGTTTMKAVARRLIKTREALGFTQAEFAREIGVAKN